MNDHAIQESAAPVAIVGAGPVGLSLALGLARRGVRSALFEREPATSDYSRAPGIHVRTREAFRQWDVEARILEAGVLRREITLHDAGARSRPLLSLDFTPLHREADRPGLVLLEQGRTEKLLLEAVLESGLCDVRFGAEVVGLQPREDGVRITVREREANRSAHRGADAGGPVERTVEAEFVVGCDGAGSFVREALGLPFEGMTYSIRPMLADIRVGDLRDSLPWPRVRNAAGGFTFTFRLAPGLWRLVRLERGDPRGGDDVPQEEINDRVTELLGPGPVETLWASRFRIHRRASPRFRVGRVLLAGDAAHVHSPAGGLGMNAGIQDAHNLAWKLAVALRGGDTDRLLESYDIERRAVVVGGVSRYTDLITRALLQTPAVVRAAGFFLWRWALRVPGLRSSMLRRATMIDLDYPASPLLDPNERAAGVRLPNPPLRSRDGREVRLYDLLRYRPVILAIGTDHDGPLALPDGLPVEEVIRIGPGARIDPTGSLRKLVGGPRGWILVRPDGHVAWARQEGENGAGLAGIDEAVSRALGARG